MVTSRKSMRWILLGAATVIVLAGAGITAWIWQANYRAWHNPRATPLFGQIEPADGATVYESDLWISWSSPEANRARVLWRKRGDLRVRDADAGSGQELLAHLAPVTAGAKYEYIVEETRGDQTLRSSVRTLNVKSGLAFEPVVEQTIERDYDQTVKLTLRNRSSQPIVVSAKALKRFADLPADITGYGSVEVPAQLAPNSTLDLRLAVTADDATRGSYEIPVEAAGAYVTARFNVHIPKLSLSFSIAEEDPKTLTKAIYIHNKGDTLSDLTVRVVPANQQDLELQPAVNHALLHAASGVYLKVAPILYLEFQSLKAEIEASAAGQTVRFPLEFQVPPGVRLIAFRSASTWFSFGFGRHCTNHPNSCTTLPARGNGPLLLAAAGAPVVPARVECNESTCDLKQACEDIDALQKLIKRYDSESFDHPDMFSRFTREFDTLLRGLSDSDLACRFNANSPIKTEVTTLLGRVHRDRLGFENLTKFAFFPRSSVCPTWKEVQLRLPRRNPESECRDFRRMADIARSLDQIADALGCVAVEPPKKDWQQICPGIEALETFNGQVEKATRVTHELERMAKPSDPKMKEGFERTAANFEEISKILSPVIKAGKLCEKAEKLLNELQDFLEAIAEINKAGCNALAMEQGFDHLFRAAGALGQELPIPILQPVFKLLAADKTFFETVGGELNPEQRWAREFAQTEGYVFTCHP